MTQPKLGDEVVCPQCGSRAMMPMSDKAGRFYVCASCSFNKERIRGLKRRTSRRNKGAK